MVVRPDWHEVPGGDLVQVEQTRRYLQTEYAVQSEVVGSLPDKMALNGFDLVHFFHLPAVKLCDLMMAKEQGMPAVLSPVFWDTTISWFGVAIMSRPIWRSVVSIFGLELSNSFYLRWQLLKQRHSALWKERRQFVKQADLLLPNSVIELHHVASHFDLNDVEIEAKSVVVPNGIIQEWYDNLAEKAYDFRKKYGLTGYILEVARIEHAKAQTELIKALWDLPYPIVLIGKETPYEDRYVQEVKNLARRRKNVHLLGQLAQSELIGAYANAVVHVLPSWRETPGLASLEAAASGSKVVSTSLGSASEYFEDLAWYCRPDNLESIRNSVLEALAAPSSTILQQRVLQNFTWKRAAQRTFEAYCQVESHPIR